MLVLVPAFEPRAVRRSFAFVLWPLCFNSAYLSVAAVFCTRSQVAEILSDCNDREIGRQLTTLADWYVCAKLAL